MRQKPIFVSFATKKLADNFDNLKDGKFQDKRLFSFIERALDDLKLDPSCGTKIQKRVWPKEYKKYGISNLWKYDLPNAWRLIYTIKVDEVQLLSIILEWFTHKEYEKRFKY